MVDKVRRNGKHRLMSRDTGNRSRDAQRDTEERTCEAGAGETVRPLSNSPPSAVTLEVPAIALVSVGVLDLTLVTRIIQAAAVWRTSDPATPPSVVGAALSASIDVGKLLWAWQLAQSEPPTTERVLHEDMLDEWDEWCEARIRRAKLADVKAERTELAETVFRRVFRELGISDTLGTGDDVETEPPPTR